MKYSVKLGGRVAGVMLLGLFGVSMASGQLVKRYELVELPAGETGQSRAYALNSTAQVIGWIETDETRHPAQWHLGATIDLHGTVHFDLLHLYPLYTVGYGEAYDISDGDQVVGTARTTIKCPETLTITNSYLLRPAVLTDIGTPYPGDALTNLGTFGNPCIAYDSAAVGISNRNHVVGWADRLDGVIHAFLVTPVNGQFFVDVLPASSGPGDPDGDYANDLMIDLGTLTADADPVSSATSVNDAGQVTGYSYTTAGVQAGYHAFLITPADMNADGVGDTWYVDGGNFNALMQDLGTLGGTNSWGRDINTAGQVVGESDLTLGTGEHYTRAFLWNAGAWTDLGSLRDDPTHGFSSAAAINDSGVVVGWAENENGQRRAFLYEGGQMYDLNDLLYLLDEDGNLVVPGIELTEARDVNADGLIVGWGQIRGVTGPAQTRGFLLNPVWVDPATLITDPNSGTVTYGRTGRAYNGDAIFGTPEHLRSQSSNDGNSPTSGTLPGLCGVGTLTFLPLTFAGLCWLKARSRP